MTQGDGFLGNLLSKYGPKIFPILKKHILPPAKQMGSEILSDMSSGRSTFKKSLKKRGLQSLGNVTRKVMTGEGRKRRGAGLRGTTTTLSTTTTTTRPRRTTRMTTRARRPPSATLVKRKAPPRTTLRKRQFRKTISWKKRGCSQKRSKKCMTKSKDIFSL